MKILEGSEPPVLGLCWGDRAGLDAILEAIRIAREGRATVQRAGVTLYRVAREGQPGSFGEPEEIDRETLYAFLDDDPR